MHLIVFWSSRNQSVRLKIKSKATFRCDNILKRLQVTASLRCGAVMPVSAAGNPIPIAWLMFHQRSNCPQMTWSSLPRPHGKKTSSRAQFFQIVKSAGKQPAARDEAVCRQGSAAAPGRLLPPRASLRSGLPARSARPAAVPFRPRARAPRGPRGVWRRRGLTYAPSAFKRDAHSSSPPGRRCRASGGARVLGDWSERRNSSYRCDPGALKKAGPRFYGYCHSRPAGIFATTD